MKKARVTLVGAKTYRMAGNRKFFKKNSPEIVTGDDVEQYANNGYFRVQMLQSDIQEEKPVKKKMTRKHNVRGKFRKDD